MANYDLPVGFHFKASFEAFKGSDSDFRFQEIGGLSVDIETEDVIEGGENRFVHKLPVRTKYGELTLKRAISVGSQLNQWLLDAIQDYKYRPSDVLIFLLNDEHQPLVTWKIVDAFPLQWSVSDFNAENSTLVIESIKLHYDYFTIDNNNL